MRNKCKFLLLVILILSLILLLKPDPSLLGYQDGHITPRPLTVSMAIERMPMQADLNQDGSPDCLTLYQGAARLCANSCPCNNNSNPVWQSPPTWRIVQAGLSDLNHDGKPEISLLVWRPFQPLPIDAYRPNSGSIDAFQNKAGESCQIILIGWRAERYQEVWAGSALAEPVLAFIALDLNSDGKQELITLDGRYEDSALRTARSLSVWRWSGFSFTSLARLEGSFRRLEGVTLSDGSNALLVY